VHHVDNLIINSRLLYRYLIVIDDVWEVQPWKTIKLAFDSDSNYEDRIMVTTRKLEVAREAHSLHATTTF